MLVVKDASFTAPGLFMSQALQRYLSSLPEWNDESVMKSLFSSFSRPRECNPEAYDSKLEFWKDTLFSCTRLGLLSESVFRLPAAPAVTSSISRKGSHPLGIAHVMSSLVERGQALPENFGVEQGSLLSRLAKMTILGPLSAGWKLFMGNEDLDQGGAEISANVGPLILNSLIEECGKSTLEAFASSFHGPSVALMTIEDLKKLANQARLSGGLAPISDPEDMNLLINHLKRTKALALANFTEGHGENLLVKLKMPGIQKVSQITPEECNIFKVRSTLSRLQDSLEALSREIQHTRSSIKKALQIEDRGMALFELRRCKALEESRKLRMNSVLSLQEVVLKIDAAQSDQELYKAYRNSEATLRSIVGDSGVTAGDIDQVVESLNELYHEHEAINLALSDPTSFAVHVDTTDLEAELELLVESPVTHELPNVPSDLVELSNDAVPASLAVEDKDEPALLQET